MQAVNPLFMLGYLIQECSPSMSTQKQNDFWEDFQIAAKLGGKKLVSNHLKIALVPVKCLFHLDFLFSQLSHYND